MSELGFSITTRLGAALQKLGQLTSSLATVGRAAARTNAQAVGAAKGMTVLAQAVSRASGAMGGMMAQFGGGIGAGGMLGRVAVGIGLATFAWKAYDAANRQAIANVRAQIAVQRELAQATRQAGQAAAAAGAGARGQEGNLRRLTALGGSSSDIDAVVGKYGIGADEAAQALVAFREAGISGPDADRGLESAEMLRMSGRMSFADAARAFAGSAGAQSRKSSAHTAAIIASEQSGQMVSPWQILNEWSRTKNDPLLRRFDTVSGIEGQQDLARRTQFATTGELSARGELARIVDPLSASLVEQNARRAEEMAVLARLAETQSALAAGIANFGMLTGGEGSLEQQRRRAQINTAAALGVGE